MKMRMAVIFAAGLMASGAPVLACDLDYLPDFAGHSYRVGMDPEEAQRAREEAMANARAAFIRQYGLNQAPAPAPDTAPVVADASASGADAR
jgi:hypothetical protein